MLEARLLSAHDCIQQVALEPSKRGYHGSAQHFLDRFDQSIDLVAGGRLGGANALAVNAVQVLKHGGAQWDRFGWLDDHHALREEA